MLIFKSLNWGWKNQKNLLKTRTQTGISTFKLIAYALSEAYPIKLPNCLVIFVTILLECVFDKLAN